jgi:hypothetical protein
MVPPGLIFGNSTLVVDAILYSNPRSTLQFQTSGQENFRKAEVNGLREDNAGGAFGGT